MQASLESTLFPLGFQEKRDNFSWIKWVEYSRDDFVVTLSTHIADQEYWIRASSKSEIKDGEKNSDYDFLISGHLSQPDKFKNTAISKLNEGLTEKIK